MKQEGRTRIIKLKSQISILNLQGCKQDVSVVQRNGKEAHFERGQVFYTGLVRGVHFKTHSCSLPASPWIGFSNEESLKEIQKGKSGLVCLLLHPTSLGEAPGDMAFRRSACFQGKEQHSGTCPGAFMETFKQASPAQPQCPAD